MPDVVFTVDQAKSMRDQAVPGHNRWHPDVPVATMVRPGQNIRVECREWTDAQIGNNDSANDVRDVQLPRVHVLSGPIAVKGAEPGDILVVDLLDVGAVEAVPRVVGRDRELRQLDVTLARDQDVLGPDVAMDHAAPFGFGRPIWSIMPAVCSMPRTQGFHSSRGRCPSAVR